jgi:hypothetical protein
MPRKGARRAKVEPEVIAHLNPKVQQRKAGLTDLFSGVGQTNNDNAHYFLAAYDNKDGTLRKTLIDLCVDVTEQRAWLDIWLRVDPERRNRMSFPDFCQLFQFDAKIEWSRRVFDIINSKLTGVITLDELFVFFLRYCIIDAEATKAFSFRLMSRRAGTCDDKSILDIQDMKTYLKFCYKIKKSQMDKVAMEIFHEMDDSGDFGLAPIEFNTYSQRNPTFVVFGNSFLCHFRKCMFGDEFWVKRSRQVKKSHAVGLGRFVFLKNANLDSEAYVRDLIVRSGVKPTVTKKKRPDSPQHSHIPLAPPLETSSSDAVKRNQRRGSVFDTIRRASAVVLGPPKEKPKVGVGPNGEIGEQWYDPDDEPIDANTPVQDRLSSMRFIDSKFDYVR